MEASAPLCKDPSSGIETRKASESLQNWITGLEQKHNLKVTISVNPKDGRVALKGIFTRDAGKTLHQRTKRKPCKKSFPDELSAIEVSNNPSITAGPSLIDISCSQVPGDMA
jgi:hypothetical protein